MSQKKLIIIAGALLAFVIILGLVVIMKGSGTTSQAVNLQFWGVFDDQNAFQAAVSAYHAINPKVQITYKSFSFNDYEPSLINAFASGQGPDIWLMHNTWLPKHLGKIVPLPQKDAQFSLADFQQQFAAVAESDLTNNGQIYALPIYLDTLALFYSKDILNAAGVATPPRTWEEFNQAVTQIAQIDQNNNINRAGAAIGTAKNINRSTDILSLLLLQSGVPIFDRQSNRASLSNYTNGKDLAEIALTYYTDFSNPAKRVYTWNDAQHYSIDAFREGTVAMMFNYSHQIKTLRQQAPRLNFSIASVPQLNAQNPINYANYWAPTVSKASANALEAWKFLVFLSSRAGVATYLNATQNPTARRDLIDEQKNDGIELAVFLGQTLTAKSWWQVDNIALEQVLADMIDDVNFSRRDARSALKAAEDKINLLTQRR